jgi:hypothetical protein
MIDRSMPLCFQMKTTTRAEGWLPGIEPDGKGHRESRPSKVVGGQCALALSAHCPEMTSFHELALRIGVHFSHLVAQLAGLP